MTRVLLAEDDASISEPLARALRREGYEVEVREDGPTALDAGIKGGVDLVVLDLGLPGMDGLEVARRLRAEGHTVPILILTARADEVDTVVGLDTALNSRNSDISRVRPLLSRSR
ncbi:Two-component system response regulator OS=Streptomyces glaucescens OX=1907 GN=SGLAU_13925 PE=4 SV=1 [Streptomyces glaucescens]